MTPDQIAVCDCGSPLVPTFHFRGAEYYCLDCGRRHGMFSTRRVHAVPELVECLEAYKAEWLEHAPALITIGAWYVKCPLCEGPGKLGNTHAEHATPEEWAAHEAATAWLQSRKIAAPV